MNYPVHGRVMVFNFYIHKFCCQCLATLSVEKVPEYASMDK